MVVKTYNKNEVTTWSHPNYWDALAVVVILALVCVFGWGAKQMLGTYQLGEVLPIHLDLSSLLRYGVRTVVRLFIALFFSLITTLILGTLAAKNRYAERLIIPIVDILQSVPVLGFLTFAVAGFVTLFKGSLLGPECAAIFGVFTAQVWNMILNFYQELKTVPSELIEAAKIFRLSNWRRFWQVEVPHAMPGLIWNMMMSLSGSWFFVIACEAFSIAGYDITLPGIGSYIFVANHLGDVRALVYAIVFMSIIIVLYDQLLFRPILYWTETFKEEGYNDGQLAKPWVVTFLQHTAILKQVTNWLGRGWDIFLNIKWFNREPSVSNFQESKNFKVVYYLLLSVALVSALTILGRFLRESFEYKEVLYVFYLGGITGLRVFIAILFSTLLWVPVGVWIGLRPRLVAKIQPIIQFFAAFPANLFFSLFAFLIVKFGLNVEIWVIPLMILGTQWYILFNVIVGTSQLPFELRLVAANLNIKRGLWWKRVILPGIAPYLVTGAITAAGGAWNASIVAEVIQWKGLELYATGLGSYISYYSGDGNSLKVALGVVVMCILVFIINRVFWKPLYDYVVERFRS